MYRRLLFRLGRQMMAARGSKISRPRQPTPVYRYPVSWKEIASSLRRLLEPGRRVLIVAIAQDEAAPPHGLLDPALATVA
ncbi:MAG: hypothetical protein H5T86_10755 [Armatimonadetes bacterium]|nr:hypothetical protein [Armatimonadota bacterium]